MRINPVYSSKIIKKGLEFASDNGALFAAGTSLVLSTFARPLVILATPNTDERNKKYACAKSISSSLIGYALMLGVSKPVSNAMKKIDANPSEYLKQGTIENLKGASKTLQGSKKYVFATQLLKLGLGFLIAAPKSVLTANFIPPIMNKMFPEKENKAQGKGVSFTGNSVAKGIGKIIDRPFIQKLSEKFHNTNFEMHIMALTDAFATGMFMLQTKHNKKIEEDRKPALMYNSAISTGLSIAGGYTLDKLTDKPTQKFIKKFVEINKNSPKLDKYIEGIKIAKPVMILGGIYYLIIPLISTALADRLDKKHN